MLDAIVSDIRLAVRTLLKSPGFAFVAIASLALGIGANSAIFSLVRATMFPVLPYAEPDRLVYLHETSPQLCAGCGVGTSYPTYLDWRAATSSFTRMGASLERQFVLSEPGEDAQVASGALVSADLFPTLGVAPAVGRNFSAEEDRTGAPRVALLSHGLWEQRFGGDTAIVGRVVRLNGVPTTVVGVMPRGFGYPEFARLWVPMAPNIGEMAREDRTVSVVARLGPDVSLERAREEMAAIGASVAAEHPAAFQGWLATVTPVLDALRADSGPPFLILLGAAAFVLLIACANLANLMLVRGARRERELAVRAALGAGRWQLVRLLLAESTVVATAGGFVGLLIALWVVDLVPRLLDTQIPFWIVFTVDWRVVLYASFLSALTAVAFGLVPALRATRASLVGSLKEGAQATGSAGRGRLRSMLVVAQISAALVLLTGAGLLIKTFTRARNLDTLGYDPRNVLTANVQALQPRYDDPAQVGVLGAEVEERVAGIPGVTAASVEHTRFLGSFAGESGQLTLEGAPEAVPDAIVPRFAKAVDTDYFTALRIPIRRGRVFTATDGATAPGVVVVNETAAEALWPGADPIGKRLKLGQPNDDRPWLTVVGVVGSTAGGSMSRRPTGFVYVPFAQHPGRPFTVTARTSGPPLAIASAVREAVRSADPDAAVFDVTTLETSLRRGMSGVTFFASLLTGMAALAIGLAALGIYGVISYAVTQRTREIGIRMALGASSHGILRLVLRYGVVMTAIGLALGAVGSFALTGVLRGILFGTSATDPVVFSAVAVVLALVSVAAAYVPARRAAALEPVIALKAD